MASYTPTAGAALTRVPTTTLESLLRSIFRKRLLFPLSRATLIAGGFGGVEGDLGALQGLDARAAQAVIVAAIAERRVARTLASLAEGTGATGAAVELVGGARHAVFAVGQDVADAPLRDALASLPAVHRVWVLPHAGAMPPALPGLDVWSPPPGAPRRAACLVVDTARVLLGEPGPGPAVRVDDAELARALTHAWRAVFADEGYSLRVVA